MSRKSDEYFLLKDYLKSTKNAVKLVLRATGGKPLNQPELDASRQLINQYADIAKAAYNDCSPDRKTEDVRKIYKDFQQWLKVQQARLKKTFDT